MKQHSITLIERLTQASGLSGHEKDIGDIFRKELSVYTDLIETDNVGNVVATFVGTNPEGPAILFAAHQDEIGFIVSDILDNGFLRIFNIGGWNTVTLPSSPVKVQNSEGRMIDGIIGQLSLLFLKKGATQQITVLEDLFVDIGASSADEVRFLFHIDIGALVVPVAPFSYVKEKDVVMSKAFDDRIGIAALIEIGKRIAHEEHQATVMLAATVQEEVGTRGAKVLANALNADMAIIVEGAPADDIPGGPSHPQTRVGNGAHVRLFDPTHIGHPGLLQHIDEVAHESNIKIQKAVRKGGGTDAVALSLAQKGIPSVVTGVPVRYAHSHNCLISLKDYFSLIDLLVGICLHTTKTVSVHR